MGVHDQPDAGLWELRTRARVHTSSAVMSWAACDRLANIARTRSSCRTGRGFWRDRAAEMREAIEKEAWYERREALRRDSFGGDELDASLLQMVDMGFLEPDDPRFLATFDAVEKGCGAARTCCAMPPRTISACRRPRSISAPSG